jgi:DNA transformation protein and related proteins
MLRKARKCVNDQRAHILSAHDHILDGREIVDAIGTPLRFMMGCLPKPRCERFEDRLRARSRGRLSTQRRVARLDPDFIRELFSQFRPVTMKRLFGGAGLYAEGLMFGLVFDAAIYLKVDETSIPDFEREGSQPFVYTRAKSPGRVGRHSLSYWRLPERLYDDPDELAVWAARALAIAERKKLAPRLRAKRKPLSKKAAGRR